MGRVCIFFSDGSGDYGRRAQLGFPHHQPHLVEQPAQGLSVCLSPAVGIHIVADLCAVFDLWKGQRLVGKYFKQ